MGRWHIILAVAAGTALAGCDATIHTYPEARLSEVVVELSVDREPPLYYKEVTYGRDGSRGEAELEATRSERYEAADSLAMRMVVELYEVPGVTDDVDEGRLVARRELTAHRLAEPPQDTVVFHVPTGTYKALAWADYVPEDGGTADWHFETEALDAVRARVEHHPGDNHHKSCAAGTADFAVDFGLDEEGYPLNLSASRAGGDTLSRFIPVGLERPAGRFRLWATDLAEFTGSGGRVEDLRVRIVYRQYVSVGYDVGEARPNDFTPTREMTTRPTTVAADGTVLLAYDYVLVGSDGEEHVLIDVYVTTADGTEVNRFEGIDVPLWENRETVVRGPFLTQEVESGRIGIDEGFEDEFVVEI